MLEKVFITVTYPCSSRKAWGPYFQLSMNEDWTKLFFRKTEGNDFAYMPVS